MIEQQLARAIRRTEKAYELYKHQKRYHQALRIFNANQYIYELLNHYIIDCNDEQVDIVLDYIFHLEDWFEQFKKLEQSITDLEEVFVFERLEFGIAYPVKFKDIIKR